MIDMPAASDKHSIDVRSSHRTSIRSPMHGTGILQRLYGLKMVHYPLVLDGASHGMDSLVDGKKGHPGGLVE